MTSGQKTGLANITEAAKFLGISDNSVRKLISEGKLPHKLVGSHRRVPWPALYDFVRPSTPEQDAVLKPAVKLSKSGKAAVAAALDRIEAEIAGIREVTKCSGKIP